MNQRREQQANWTLMNKTARAEMDIGTTESGVAQMKVERGTARMHCT